ncbi:hypothetical protein BDV23DRAFT_165205 [Aspergillus alliaceus]|uniref:Uncharacterized protein n=1 Tax=Petromyces alliaceus TaxID=209559 RepID=A0A5N7BUG3_PETAA|nr:hypothetical protein BDV23DRAFT_165205 [Aspergillus alliaceus]
MQCDRYGNIQGVYVENWPVPLYSPANILGLVLSRIHKAIHSAPWPLGSPSHVSMVYTVGLLVGSCIFGTGTRTPQRMRYPPSLGSCLLVSHPL